MGLSACMLLCVGCSDSEDDGSRGFMSYATVAGDSINGYNCYLDGGGLVVSHSRSLEGVRRGYFSFMYNKTDWTDGADGSKYIDNANVYAWSKFDIIFPVSSETADDVIDYDKCSVPTQLIVGPFNYGYLDINTELFISDSETNESATADVNLVYDVDEQTSDSIMLDLFYNRNVPDGWSDFSVKYGTVSCDLSALVGLKQWSDSVTVVVRVGEDDVHRIKVGKNDLSL